MDERARFEAWAASTGRFSPPDAPDAAEGARMDASWMAWQAATALEREACAKLCDNPFTIEALDDAQFDDAFEFIAAAIRARGGKT